MRRIISTLMIIVITATSALAGVHDDNWVHDYVTFETVQGNVLADKEGDGIWRYINSHTGAYDSSLMRISTEDILTDMSGRFVQSNQYYADATIYVGSEIDAYNERLANPHPGITDWDYFWGTTLNPELTGWNDFWNQCNDPSKTDADCAGTVFAGIGFAVGVAVVAVGWVALDVFIAIPAAASGGVFPVQLVSAWGWWATA